jgi:hypothetical protein
MYKYTLGGFRARRSFVPKERIEMVVKGAVHLQERVQISETPHAVIVDHFVDDWEWDIERGVWGCHYHALVE